MSKYDREIIGRDPKTGEPVKAIVDVYDVLEAFPTTSGPMQHLIKKALCTGLRGHKSEEQDLIDIRDSAIRALEIFNAKNKVNGNGYSGN